MGIPDNLLREALEALPRLASCIDCWIAGGVSIAGSQLWFQNAIRQQHDVPSATVVRQSL